MVVEMKCLVWREVELQLTVEVVVTVPVYDVVVGMEMVTYVLLRPSWAPVNLLVSEG